ncbi:MAG: hypothetical protein U1E65_03140 [Myxococcota bacterium]
MKKPLLSVIGTSILVGALAGGAGYAYAERQPHMREAHHHLEQALESLRKADNDKGGHRVKAIELVEGALREVKEGIAFDDKH